MLRGSRSILIVLICLNAVTLEGWSANIAEASGDSCAKHLRITLTGDLLLDRGVRSVIERDGGDALFGPHIDSLFQLSDIVIANLECPATHIHAPQQKPYVFRGDPEMLSVLRRHGITHLNLANNHSIDQGRRGLLDTYNNIRAREGLTPLGAGNSMTEAARPVLLAQVPRKVWIVTSNRLPLENFAYLPQQSSISQEPFDSLLCHIRSLRAADTACYIIVYPHWGREHTKHPTLDQRNEARQMIDAGAYIIVGHHPHCIQHVEYYRGKPVFYSIGNFIFDQSAPLNSEGLVISIVLSADGVSVERIPIHIKDCRVDI